MNIRDNTILEKYLKSLSLSPANLALALEYITADNEDDTLLARTQPMDLSVANRGWYDEYDHLNTVWSTDPGRLGRYLKLFWAMGKTTVIFPWYRTFRDKMHKETGPEWMTTVLPRPVVAAIQAERVVWRNYSAADASWLCQEAKRNPKALEQAMQLSGTGNGHMETLLAAMIVYGNADETIVERQREYLVGQLTDCIADVAPWMSPVQLQEMKEYIEKGDCTAIPPLPFQLTAKNALGSRHSHHYLTGIYSMCAFLAAQAEPRAKCALRCLLELNPDVVLENITIPGLSDIFEERFDDILPLIPGGSTTMLLYLSFGSYWIVGDLKKRLMRRCLDGLEEAMELARPNQFMGLAEQLPEAWAMLGDERERVCNLFSKYLVGGKTELWNYLTGSGSLKNSRKELKNVSAGTTAFPGMVTGFIVSYRMGHGWDDFACRCAAVLGIVFNGGCLDNIVSNMTKEQAEFVAGAGFCHFSGKLDTNLMPELLEALLERELSMADVLTFCGHLHDSGSEPSRQERVRSCAYQVAAKAEYIPDLRDAAKNGSVFARQTAIRALFELAVDHADAKAGVLAVSGDSSKQIREELVKLYTSRPEWVEDYRKLLNAKKAAERLLAVEVLSRLGRRDILEQALAAEKQAKVADAIRAALGAVESKTVGSVEELAAGLTKGNKLKKLGWLLDKGLPAVHKADGSDADDAIRNAILLSYCELGRVGRSDTAAELAAVCDAGDLSRLACEVYEHWYAAGAQAKHKWVLSFAAVFGGAPMTQRLKSAISDWPNHQRGAIACDAVMALALSSDPAAIVIVDAISRKFKFRQVKQAAAAALENAAKELGITAEELADRIVPDLGFGKDGKRVFDYGKRSFTVRLTPTLELDIRNDQGKTVKNLPAPGKTDDPQAAEAYEEFKNMKKQIKTTVTAQRARLELALSVLRCWDTEHWRDLFVGNPIMHQFAMSLIWGVYVDGVLTDTFRYMEDGSFNTVDEEEYELPEGAKIGLVHPVELDEETLEGWKQQLEDYEIVQSIEQLSRQVYALDDAKANDKALEDFAGKMLNGLSLSGKLLGLGWYRGSVQDGGMFNTFYREDAGLGLGVELRFSGSAVGFDDGEPVTVYEAVFYRGTVKRGSYIYDEPKPEDIVPLGNVPRRYYSEIILHLTRATASSTEHNENWRNDR